MRGRRRQCPRKTLQTPGKLVLVILLVTGSLTSADGSSHCLKGSKGANCNFISVFRRCKWQSKEWTIKSISFFGGPRLDTDRFDHGKMESPRLCSTQQATHCLRFGYTFHSQTQPVVTLTVLLEVEGKGTTPIWRITVDNRNSLHAEAPIQTKADFKIIFQVDKPPDYNPGVGSYVRVRYIKYRESTCRTIPPHARVEESTTTTKLATTAVTILRTTPATTRAPTRRTATPAPGRSSPPTADGRGTGEQQSASSTVGVDEGGSVLPASTSAAGVVAPSPGKTSGDGALSLQSSVIIAGGTVAVVIAIVVAAGLLVAKYKNKLCFRERTTSKEMKTDAAVMAPSANRAREADMYITGNDACEIAASPLYDTTGELSPPNRYAALQMTSRNVTIASATSTALYSNSSDTGEASHYCNVRGHAPSDVGVYGNVPGPVTASGEDGQDYYEVLI